jgi:hypothetical protein
MPACRPRCNLWLALTCRSTQILARQMSWLHCSPDSVIGRSSRPNPLASDVTARSAPLAISSTTFHIQQVLCRLLKRCGQKPAQHIPCSQPETALVGRPGRTCLPVGPGEMGGLARIQGQDQDAVPQKYVRWSSFFLKSTKRIQWGNKNSHDCAK